MKRKLTLVSLLYALGTIGLPSAWGQDASIRILVGLREPSAAKLFPENKPKGIQIHHRFVELGVVAMTVPRSAIADLVKDPDVLFVEEDPQRFPYAESVPYGIDKVQAREVWDRDQDGVIDPGAYTGAGILVCIIDSGLSTSHEEFRDLGVVGGYPANFDKDGCGHGTHVAGTITAALNGIGVVGVSPGKVPLFIVKVFGTGSQADGCGWSYASDLIDAASHCAQAGARVISMSLGGLSPSQAEERAFQRLYDAGLLSIAAAGNGGDTSTSYPAGYQSVVSVAALDSSDAVASFSQQNPDVELAAPGVDVLSSVPWFSQNDLQIQGTTYGGRQLEGAAFGKASGILIEGGLCATKGAWSGKIVLCLRGDLTFREKVQNVEDGGGLAALVFNNGPGNFNGTLGEGNTSRIPALSFSQEDGQLLLQGALGKSGEVLSFKDFPGSGYEAWQGTSMATPHVSGVAALVWSANPALTNAQIREALDKTALDLGPAGRDDATGYGLVQARKALEFGSR